MATTADLFKQKLRLYREHKQLSQRKLADLTELSPAYISELEMGRRAPTFATIDKLARALGIRPFQFFYEGTEDEETLLQSFADSIIATGTSLVLESFKSYQQDSKKEASDQ